MLLPSKSAGSEYTAAEWSQIKDEIQAFIQGSGMTLSASALTQMRETVMRNVTAGRDCVVGGTANAITLTTRSPFVAGKPTVYQAGATYSALITTTNTGAVTVNANNIGIVPLKKKGYTEELVAGDIAVPALYDVVIKADLSAAELVAKKSSFEGNKGRLVKRFRVSGTFIANDTADDSVEAYITSLQLKSGRYLARLIGGTGGGGKGQTSSGDNRRCGGGGGSGGVTEGVIDFTTDSAFVIGSAGIGATVTSGGAGGTTTFIALSALGGVGGGNNSGGSGGVGTTFTGASGQNGDSINSNVYSNVGGRGGGWPNIGGAGGNITAGGTISDGEDGEDGILELYEWEA